jgi:hypothetical protein
VVELNKHSECVEEVVLDRADGRVLAILAFDATPRLMMPRVLLAAVCELTELFVNAHAKHRRIGAMSDVITNNREPRCIERDVRCTIDVEMKGGRETVSCAWSCEEV